MPDRPTISPSDEFIRRTIYPDAPTGPVMRPAGPGVSRITPGESKLKEYTRRTIEGVTDAVAEFIGIPRTPLIGEKGSEKFIDWLLRSGGVDLVTAGIPIPFSRMAYHSTRRKFNLFDPRKTRKSDTLGRYQHVAFDKDYADSWRPGGRTIPVNVKSKNAISVYDLSPDDIEAIKEVIPKLKLSDSDLNNLGSQIRRLEGGITDNYNISSAQRDMSYALSNMDAISPGILEKAGFDSVHYSDVGAEALAVPSPRQIINARTSAPMGMRKQFSKMRSGKYDKKLAPWEERKLYGEENLGPDFKYTPYKANTYDDMQKLIDENFPPDPLKKGISDEAKKIASKDLFKAGGKQGLYPAEYVIFDTMSDSDVITHYSLETAQKELANHPGSWDMANAQEYVDLNPNQTDIYIIGSNTHKELLSTKNRVWQKYLDRQFSNKNKFGPYTEGNTMGEYIAFPSNIGSTGGVIGISEKEAKMLSKKNPDWDYDTLDEYINTISINDDPNIQFLDTYVKNKTQLGQPNPSPSFSDSPKFMDDLLMNKKSPAKGSNPGGVYYDPVGAQNYYVKQYKDPNQAWSESLSNSIYNDLGIDAPNSAVRTDSLGDTYHISRYMEDAKPLYETGLTEEKANKILDGFAADVLLGNWDAVGMGLDNIVESGGKLYRIDQGGTLYHRAQGGLKPEEALGSIDEWTTFVTKNPDYKQVFDAAGIKNADELGQRVIDQIDNITNEFGTGIEGWQKYVYKKLPNAPEDFKLEVADLLAERAFALWSKF